MTSHKLSLLFIPRDSDLNDIVTEIEKIPALHVKKIETKEMDLARYDNPSTSLEEYERAFGPQETAQELLAKVLRYRMGQLEYNFSHLNENDRANAAFDAWNELEIKIKNYLNL